MSETERGPVIRSAPVKITDVAAAAGVSPMTVSRVINTPDRVSPETTARVREAIDRLGYVPDLLASEMSSRAEETARAATQTAASIPVAAEVMSEEEEEAITRIYHRIDRELAVSEARADRLLAQRAAR